MKALLRAAYEKIKQAPKKILNYIKSRTTEALLYGKDIAIAAGINGLIMIPLALTTQLIMHLMGFKFPTAPIFPDGNPPLLLLPLVAFGIGLFEETYCRYFIMDCMLTKWLKAPAWLAIAYSSLIFGAMHFGNGMIVGNMWAALPQVVGATGAGVWFALCYRRRGLHFAIFTHALYDFVLMSLLYI